jgi:hypothetical protein
MPLQPIILVGQQQSDSSDTKILPGMKGAALSMIVRQTLRETNRQVIVTSSPGMC